MSIPPTKALHTNSSTATLLQFLAFSWLLADQPGNQCSTVTTLPVIKSRKAREVLAQRSHFTEKPEARNEVNFLSLWHESPPWTLSSWSQVQSHTNTREAGRRARALSQTARNLTQLFHKPYDLEHPKFCVSISIHICKMGARAPRSGAVGTSLRAGTRSKASTLPGPSALPVRSRHARRSRHPPAR